MNPGLIPPADVAAAAKRGLELRKKFHRGGTSVGALPRAPLACGCRDVILSRHYRGSAPVFARHEAQTRRRKATNGETKPTPPQAISPGSCGAASPAAAGPTV